jgi:hypothetical protein
MLAVLGRTEGRLDEHSRLMEIYTLEGLLSIWWFGDPGATDVVLMVGGAAGGVLGPGHALYLELGRSMAGRGRAAMAVDYRRPGDIDRCLLDVAAAADLAIRHGAERFCMLGHSFGGAVAIQAAATLPDHTAGIITYSTQSAGCEDASQGRPGEVQTFPGADHLLEEVADELSETTHHWVVEQFTRHAGSTA